MAMSDLRFAMYLDEELYSKYSVNADKWHEDFQDNVVPMALASEGERLALRKFARSWRSKQGTAAEVPKWLLQGSIPASYALGHILHDELEVMHYRQRKLCACICIRSPNQLYVCHAAALDTCFMSQQLTQACDI